MDQRQQKGMTTLGWIIVIAIFSFIVVTGFKILPLYLDFLNVKNAMKSVEKLAESGGNLQGQKIDPRSKRDLWIALSNQLRINSVYGLKRENFKFKRKDGVTTVTVDYEARKPYFDRMFIGAHFVHSVDINK
jgi:hypothetical protein